MSEIEDLVKNEIDEFGDRAHERFLIDRSMRLVGSYGFYNPVSNNELSQHLGLELKPMAELFAHDMSFYVNAFEMWEWDLKGIETHNFYNNEEPLLMMDLSHKGFNVSRKTSVAREFCLDDAKAGDVVEVFDGNPDSGWSLAKYEGRYEQDNSIIVSRASDNYRMRVYSNDLRHKYPKKVQS